MMVMRMPDQPKVPAIVGEDGELIQPDTTVDPEAYSEFVATYVHRDPLWFRVRENVKQWGCAYLWLIPIGFFSIVLLSDTRNSDELVQVIGFLILVMGMGYWTLHHDTRA
jgi:hypothetical protein